MKHDGSEDASATNRKRSNENIERGEGEQAAAKKPRDAISDVSQGTPQKPKTKVPSTVSQPQQPARQRLASLR